MIREHHNHKLQTKTTNTAQYKAFRELGNKHQGSFSIDL